MGSWEKEKQRQANFTPEQREAFLKRNREYQASRRAARTEEQRGIELLYFRERQALLSDEEREAQAARGRNLPPERRAAKKKKHNERTEEQKHKDRIRNRLRNQRANGFTPELIDSLLQEQNGCCAICQSLLIPGLHTHADHCHATTTHRGMLCAGCNKGIGSLKDSPELLRAAALYIEYWRNRK